MKMKILSVAILLLCSFAALASSTNEESKKEKALRLKGNKNTQSVVVTPVSSTSLSPQKQYEILVQKHSMLTQEIEAINVSISSLPRGKAKKAMKRMQQMELELNSVTTSMSLFPKSITEKGYAAEIEAQQKAEFMKELNAKSDKLIAANNPFAGQISLDPELEAAYRKYLAEGGAVAMGVTDFDKSENHSAINDMLGGKDQFYSVLFAIADKPLSVDKFPYEKVYTQKLKNGKIAYFAGSYDNQKEANVVCNQILAKGVYRDSFVVLIK